MSGFRCQEGWTLFTGCELRVAGCGVRSAKGMAHGVRLKAEDYRVLFAGYSSLVICHWSLDTGCGSFDCGFRNVDFRLNKWNGQDTGYNEQA